MNRKIDDRGDRIAEFGAERPKSNGHARQKLPPEVHAFLGHRLRAVYSDLINEPVPGPLLDLLDRLKAQEIERDGSIVRDTNEAKEKA
jgi:hypothetical protein